MIDDKNVKELLDDLKYQLESFNKEMRNSKNATNKAYYEGVAEGLERSINSVNFFNHQPTKKSPAKKSTTRRPARK